MSFFLDCGSFYIEIWCSQQFCRSILRKLSVRYDMIPLWYKLYNFGINANIFLFISNFLPHILFGVNILDLLGVASWTWKRVPPKLLSLVLFFLQSWQMILYDLMDPKRIVWIHICNLILIYHLNGSILGFQSVPCQV